MESTKEEISKITPSQQRHRQESLDTILSNNLDHAF